MQFTSYEFILLLLPVQIIAFFLLSRRNPSLGKISLIAGSLVFYLYEDLSLSLPLLFSVLFNYIFACLLRKRRRGRAFVAIPIVVNVALLFAFKYTNFTISCINGFLGKDFTPLDILQPVGISFFTFQQIAYLVSVYQGTVGNSLLDYLVYILYFPKILMGPLMEPVDFFDQLNDSSRKKPCLENIASGIKLFSFGMFKKLLLADTFAKAVAWGYSNFSDTTAMDWILIGLFYSFEIYFDFSGYCDMATGASLFLNITLPINFDSPYKALCIRDFWKRWHISLTTFFTRYIYIPLGGSRKGTAMTCVNTMLVFLISGLWHGASWTFLLWGGLHGLLSLFDRFTARYQEKVFTPVRWMLTFCAVNLLWLLFRSDSISQWVDILRKLFFLENTYISEDLLATFSRADLSLLLHFLPSPSTFERIRGLWMLVFTFTSLAICLVPDTAYRNRQRLTKWELLLAAAAFVWSFTCIGGESVFVYFNF